MIAIARKNLASLFWNPNSFICKSNPRFFPSIHFFSTSNLFHSPEIYDVLVNKHQFSPELASSLPALRFPKRADSVLSFLKEISITTAQLEKMVKCDPRILGYTVESLKSRLKVFQDLGLSSEEIAKIFSSNQRILHSSVANRILPSLLMLKRLLGSNDEVARLLKKCSWFLNADLEKILIPNVEYLKSCGMQTEHILHSLYLMPRCFLFKPDIMRKSVNKAMEIGVPLTFAHFIHAARVFACMSEEMWEVKLQTLRDLGFSDNDMFAMFRKQPTFFAISGKMMKNKVEFVLASGKYDISSIVACPTALTCSIEKRIEPRMQIMRLLESRNLIQKWPPLSTFLQLRDDKFIERYIRPYYDEIGEEHITRRYIPRPKGEIAQGTGMK